MKNRTLAIIKPDATERNISGQILAKIQEAGFDIVAIKLGRLEKHEAEAFYAVHSERPFFNSLVEYMTSGRIICIALEKENAVEDYRTLIGATDPKEAAEGTIRNLFAESKERNSVHGSDSDENAEKEIGFFFSKLEITTKL